MGEALAPTACLPDAVVRLLPVLADPVDQRREVHPVVVADELAVTLKRLPLGEIDRVEQLAVDVELHLPGGVVADPDRP